MNVRRVWAASVEIGESALFGKALMSFEAGFLLDISLEEGS
jgi:hypothetical protein